jgi:hypothetical protein
MYISLKKFGTTLVSRPSGKEAFLVSQPLFNEIKDNEKIEIDFEGIAVLTPSWADEFITPLQEKYKNVVLINTDNPSVQATLTTLEKSKNSQ